MTQYKWSKKFAEQQGDTGTSIVIQSVGYDIIHKPTQ